MSRRKQPNPRHLESELELASLLENGTSQAVTSPTPTSKDAHVCGKCRAEFINLAEFLAHKKTCTKKRIVVMFDEDNRPGDNESLPKSPSVGYEDEDLENEDIYSAEMSEDEFGDTNMNEEKDDENSDEDEDEDKKDGENAMMLLSQSKIDLVSQLPHLLPFLPNTNVTLEPMPATKAAVAQFAENNLMPQDLAMMSATLYNLQQQQLVQLQLIQQLQQQLMTGMKTPVAPATQSGPTLTPPIPVTSCGLSVSTSCGLIVSSNSTTNSEDKTSNSEESQTTVSKSGSMTSTTPAVSTPLPSLGSSAFSQLQKEATGSTTGTMLPPTSVSLSASNSEFRHRGTMLERSQYASDDPFFKHKCRFCHKVFGSDSALQIHVRSHTGERPFKCHICGNRFSTKGNLKVHFERHKAKYPNAKMNPYPQPEHLERVPPPSLHSNPFLSAPMPSSMPLPMGLLTTPLSSIMSSVGPTMPSPSPSPVAPRPRERSSSPDATPKNRHSSPPPASEAPPQKSPSKDVPHAALSMVSTSTTPTVPRLSLPSPVMPSHVMPSHSLPATPTSFPLPSPLAATLGGLTSPFAPLPPPPTQSMESPMFRGSILPSKTIDANEDLERYMECKKSETSKLEQLVKNIEEKITDPNQCVICKRVLSCKSALQMHYRIHTGERPFKCKICGRSFTTKGNLKTHMGVHRSKPPLRMMHQCPVCHKQFTNLLVLQQHIRMHTGESMHEMPHAAMYHHPEWAPKPFDPHKLFEPRPFDLSGHYEPKELDLSKSGSYGSGFDQSGCNKDLDTSLDGSVDDFRSDIEMKEDEDLQDLENGEQDLDGNVDQDLMDEKDMDVADEEMMQNQDDERPQSMISGGSQSGRSPTPSQDHLSPSSRPESRGTPVITNSFSSPYYSTSLAALEERVKAIDSQMAQASFERFRNSMGLGHGTGLMEKTLSPPSLHGYQNGERSPTSPRSQSASEAGSDGCNVREDMGHSGYSSLPMNPDNPIPFGPGFPMMGVLDLRPGSGERKYNTTCNICLKTFACRSALEIHYRSHTKERPYKCEVCDRSFSTRGNMRQHMLTHKIRDLPSQAFSGSNDSGSGKEENDVRSEPRTPQSQASHQSTNYSSPESTQKVVDSNTSTTTNNNTGSTDNPSNPSIIRNLSNISNSSNLSPPSNNTVPNSNNTVPNSNNTVPNSNNTGPNSNNTGPNSNSTGSNSNNSGSISNSGSGSNNSGSGSNNTCSGSSNNNKDNSDNINSNISNSGSSNKTPPQHGISGSNSSRGNIKGTNSDGSPFLRRSTLKHQCLTCMKTFSSASALQIHIRTHTGDKPFKCTVCGKAFTTRGNLKVHMGTHMWSNSPSRRGRRMSIEPPFLLSHIKDNPFLAGFPHRPPDFYFQYPPFMNGMPPKMNEISVIQSVNGGMNHMPSLQQHASLYGLKEEHKENNPDNRDKERDRDIERAHLQNGGSSPSESKHATSSGELDLSVRSSSSASANSASSLSSPHSKDSPLDNPQSSPAWLWKAGSCHICSQTFPSPAALEQHIQSQHMSGESQKALVA